MVAVPADTPVTAPVVDPTVATPGLPLVQVPPEVPSVKVVEEPTQTLAVPPIVAGSGLMVTALIAKHPVDNV